MAALAAKSLVINDISAGSKGVLGGPVALAAIQGGTNQVSIAAASGTEDPARVIPQNRSNSQSSNLSTGTLDGAQVFQAISASGAQNGPSLLEDNKKAIKAAAALVNPETATKKAPTRYFIQPTSGKNWGVLHANNAVDIANSCGTPVIAAADGRVVNDSSLGTGASGWNSGFGRFILLKHPNGTKTRYAHLSKIYVAVGEDVEQGQEIGQIGNTGRVDGATGCHLHFEVLGGSNPFVRR